MPRRKPVAAVKVRAAAVLSVDDLDELLNQAGVPKDQREDCARDINQRFDFYGRRLARKNAPSEASQAESLRVVANAARELFKALASLPPGLRLSVEPNYQAFIRKGFALYVARATAYTLAAKETAERNPDAQWLADQTASMPQSAREEVKRASRKLLSAARAPLPLELILAALIEAADKAGAAMEKRVSGTWSKRRGILARNELALNLKAIVMAYSPKSTNNERAAEDWAARVLCAAGIRAPHRETKPAAFRAMFGR